MKKLFLALFIGSTILSSCSEKVSTFENEDFSFSFPTELNLEAQKLKNPETSAYNAGIFPIEFFESKNIKFHYFPEQNVINFTDLRGDEWIIALGENKLKEEGLKNLMDTFSYTEGYQEKVEKEQIAQALEQEEIEKKREEAILEHENNLKRITALPQVQPDLTDYSEAGLFDQCLGMEAYTEKSFFKNFLEDFKIEKDGNFYTMQQRYEVGNDPYSVSRACYSEKLNRFVAFANVGELGKTPHIVIDYDTLTREKIYSNALFLVPLDFEFGERKGEILPLFYKDCRIPGPVCFDQELSYNLRTKELKIVNQ